MKPLPDAEKPAKRPGRGRPTHDQVGKRYAAELRGGDVHPVALKLKAWRVRNGLSQPQAAEVLRGFFFYVTFSTLRSWEEGQRVPPTTRRTCSKRCSRRIRRWPSRRYLLPRPVVPFPKGWFDERGNKVR